MTGHVLLQVEMPTRRRIKPVAENVEWLHAALAYRLSNGGIENPIATYSFGAGVNTDRISGAIFLSLTPKQLKFLILDARVSIVLARQRHLDDEQYRRRLADSPHYRALRPYLSQNFKEMMVPHSNWHGYRFAVSRLPILINAYENEIERLKMELLKVTEGSVSVVYLTTEKMRPTRR